MMMHTPSRSSANQKPSAKTVPLPSGGSPANVIISFKNMAKQTATPSKPSSPTKMASKFATKLSSALSLKRSDSLSTDSGHTEYSTSCASEESSSSSSGTSILSLVSERMVSASSPIGKKKVFFYASMLDDEDEEGLESELEEADDNCDDLLEDDTEDDDMSVGSAIASSSSHVAPESLSRSPTPGIISNSGHSASKTMSLFGRFNGKTSPGNKCKLEKIVSRFTEKNDDDYSNMELGVENKARPLMKQTKDIEVTSRAGPYQSRGRQRPRTLTSLKSEIAATADNNNDWNFPSNNHKSKPRKATRPHATNQSEIDDVPRHSKQESRRAVSAPSICRLRSQKPALLYDYIKTAKDAVACAMQATVEEDHSSSPGFDVQDKSDDELVGEAIEETTQVAPFSLQDVCGTDATRPLHHSFCRRHMVVQDDSTSDCDSFAMSSSDDEEDDCPVNDYPETSRAAASPAAMMLLLQMGDGGSEALAAALFTDEPSPSLGSLTDDDDKEQGQPAMQPSVDMLTCAWIRSPASRKKHLELGFSR